MDGCGPLLEAGQAEEPRQREGHPWRSAVLPLKGIMSVLDLPWARTKLLLRHLTPAFMETPGRTLSSSQAGGRALGRRPRKCSKAPGTGHSVAHGQPLQIPGGRGIMGPMAATGGFPPDTHLSALLVSGVHMCVWLAEMRGSRVPPNSPPPHPKVYELLGGLSLVALGAGHTLFLAS